MKKLTILLCLLLSVIINAQSVNFDEKLMNSTVFASLNQNNGYHLFHSNAEKKIYRFIKRNNDRMMTSDMITRINQKVAREYVGVFTRVSCNSNYQELANKCNKDWNNPSDAFFKNGWGENIIVVSYYNKRTNLCYVYVGFN